MKTVVIRVNKKNIVINILLTILCLGLSSVVFFWEYKKITTPVTLYRVYLQGKTIGYVKDKDILEEYIDNEQSELKAKYGVDRVYPPNDLDIVKEITYNQKVYTEKEIYDKIKGISPFTVNGYTVTIKGIEVTNDEAEKTTTSDAKIYVIDKETFNKAAKNTVNIFVSETDYNNFINNTQPELGSTGTVIEDIYIKNKIYIKKGRISTQEKIFTDVDELNQYLLFGTNEKQKEYVVRDGDNIADVAFTNMLSVKEFLIANPDFTSENNLLYAGQVVNLGLINPKFNLIEEDHVVSMEQIKYETKIEYDENTLVGSDRVIQEGSDGIAKVVTKVQKVNGQVESSIVASSEQIKAPVTRIIVKGSKVIPNVAIDGLWTWPTKSTMISSGYGYRGGKFHAGLDIGGQCGDPIYAANNGTIDRATYNSINGNFIYINHNDAGNHYTVYAHLSSIYVSAGQSVQIGQLIGTMGRTGLATGCHLHFSLTIGNPWSTTHGDLNPWSLYR